VDQNYLELERLSHGVRLKAEHIRAGIAEYGRVLALPPEGIYDLLDIILISNTHPAEYSIRCPLYTAEEGRSDLEVQATLIDDSTNAALMRFEIDGILVP
jgi:hypothetical protein